MITTKRCATRRTRGETNYSFNKIFNLPFFTLRGKTAFDVKTESPRSAALHEGHEEKLTLFFNNFFDLPSLPFVPSCLRSKTAFDLKTESPRSTALHEGHEGHEGHEEEPTILFLKYALTYSSLLFIFS